MPKFIIIRKEGSRWYSDNIAWELEIAMMLKKDYEISYKDQFIELAEVRV